MIHTHKMRMLRFININVVDVSVYMWVLVGEQVHRTDPIEILIWNLFYRNKNYYIMIVYD